MVWWCGGVVVWWCGGVVVLWWWWWWWWWCGVVWCGVVWCGVVRCGAVRCGAVRCGAVRCGAVRCGAVRCVVVFACLNCAKRLDPGEMRTRGVRASVARHHPAAYWHRGHVVVPQPLDHVRVEVRAMETTIKANSERNTRNQRPLTTGAAAKRTAHARSPPEGELATFIWFTQRRCCYPKCFQLWASGDGSCLPYKTSPKSTERSGPPDPNTFTA